MRKISVKLSEKVYVMSCDLNMSNSNLIRESLNSAMRDCRHKRRTSVYITDENEVLLEQVSRLYYMQIHTYKRKGVEKH